MTDIVPIAPPVSETSTLVQSIMSESGLLASTAQASALNAIQQLGNFSLTLPPLASPVGPPLPNVVVPAAGDTPIEPNDTTPVFPALPIEPALTDLATIDLGSSPEFDVASPFLIDVPLPDPLSVLVPYAPTLSAIAVPVEPDFTLPAVPTMLSLNLPSVPVIDLPIYSDVLGEAPGAPSAEFSWGEVAYDTALLTQMNSRLVDLVAGGSTGLAADVESAIFNRGRDREILISQRAIEESNRMFSARGFSMPAGTLVRIVQQAVMDSVNKESTLSRDIMIKQAELEQSNFQFSFNAAIQLESNLLNHFNSVQARAFEAQKFTFEAVIQIFNARVQLYQADVQAFVAKAEVFKTRLQAALAQLDVYKSQLEGQKLIGDLNTQQTQQYVAQLEGVKTTADVFRSRVEAVKVQVEAQKEEVAIYTAQLQGYDSQVRAKTSEYEAYGTRVKAELTKTQMFGEQVGAYKSRVEAYGTLVNAKLAEQTLDFKQLQEFPLEVYKQRIATYQIGVAAESERVKALVALFEGRVRAFAATEQAKTSQVSAQVEAVKAVSTVYTAQAGLTLQAGETNLKLAVSAAETAQASLRAAGQLSGQLAAAAMSSRNVHASLSHGDNYGYSNSVSQSISQSEVVSDSRSVSESTSHSTSDSTSRADVNSISHSTSESTSFVESTSDSTSRSTSDSIVHSYSQSTSDSTNHSVSYAQSFSQSESTSLSTSTNYGYNNSNSTSNTISYSHSYGNSETTSWNHNYTQTVD